jgi:hypothetical protein
MLIFLKFSMINIICWKWKSGSSLREEFTAEHVNRLYLMLKKNTTLPFKLICITDDAAGILPEIKIVKIWDSPVKPDTKTNKPNCYRRLKVFAPEMKEILGERILSIDLDCVIVGNIDHILKRQEDFIAWHIDVLPFNGSLFMHTIGTRPEVWVDFDPVKSPIEAARFTGSDQAWLCHKLSAKEATFTGVADGIYSYKKAIIKNNYKLPENASIVFFHGQPKQDHPEVLKRCDWIKKSYYL